MNIPQNDKTSFHFRHVLWHEKLFKLKRYSTLGVV